MTSASNFGSGPAVVAAAGISIVLGIASIWGAYRRWRWLVDPNVAGWPFYSQSFVKKFFGTNALLGFTYFLGASMVGFWFMGYVESLKLTRYKKFLVAVPFRPD